MPGALAMSSCAGALWKPARDPIRKPPRTRAFQMAALAGGSTWPRLLFMYCGERRYKSISRRDAGGACPDGSLPRVRFAGVLLGARRRRSASRAR